MSANRTIFRVACRHKPYSQLGNDMLLNAKLSIGARGGLAMILSRPSNWSFNISWFCTNAGVGRDKARAILRELASYGYCKRRQVRNYNGTMDCYEYVFTDEPDNLDGEPIPETEKPSPVETGDAFTGAGQPVTGKPAPGNPPTTKNDLLTKKDKKKKHTGETPACAPSVVDYEELTLVTMERDGSICLSAPERDRWEVEFGDAEALNLALTQAAGYVQSASSRPLLVQVRAQLARQLQQRKDFAKRDARREKARAERPAGAQFESARDKRSREGAELIRQLRNGEI